MKKHECVFETDWRGITQCQICGKLKMYSVDKKKYDEDWGEKWA